MCAWREKQFQIPFNFKISVGIIFLTNMKKETAFVSS